MLELITVEKAKREYLINYMNMLISYQSSILHDHFSIFDTNDKGYANNVHDKYIFGKMDELVDILENKGYVVNYYERSRMLPPSYEISWRLKPNGGSIDSPFGI